VDIPKFKIIPNWQQLKLKCNHCGTTKSVKYDQCGEPHCNICVVTQGDHINNPNDYVINNYD
jgi:hypothetical protein